MALALLYNLPPEKMRKVKFALLKLGIKAKEVLPDEFGCALGYSAELEGFTAEKTEGENFTDEMLVFCDFSEGQLNRFLDGIRKAKASVPLKCVLTETNAKWNSYELHREIKAEHEAMKTGNTAHEQ